MRQPLVIAYCITLLIVISMMAFAVTFGAFILMDFLAYGKTVYSKAEFYDRLEMLFWISVMVNVIPIKHNIKRYESIKNRLNGVLPFTPL